MQNFAGFVAFLSSEFHRYLMENEPAAEHVPANALIVFNVAGEERFNKWHRETSLRNRESDQPILEVHVGRLRSHSAFEEVELEAMTA